MRNLLLLMGLSMLGVLLSASVALAQDFTPPGFYFGSGADNPCPQDIEQFPAGTKCGEGGGYLVPNSPSASPTASASATASANASASAAGPAQYQYTSALPGTGGVVSPVALLAIIPAILLLGGGLLSARLIRCS